jgi:hypothetical protein
VLRFHRFGGPNDDLVLIDGDTVQAAVTVSSGPRTYTQIFLEGGVILQVTESATEVGDAVQAWKESRKAQS